MVNIRIAGHNDFPCPVGWTVEQAKEEIRSRYRLDGGGIDRSGQPMLPTDTITADGNYKFVNFQPQQAKGSPGKTNSIALIYLTSFFLLVSGSIDILTKSCTVEFFYVDHYEKLRMSFFSNEAITTTAINQIIHLFYLDAEEQPNLKDYILRNDESEWVTDFPAIVVDERYYYEYPGKIPAESASNWTTILLEFSQDVRSNNAHRLQSRENLSPIRLHRS